MKRILLFFIVVALAASCLDGGKFNQSSPLFVTFEAETSVFGTDSLYFNTSGKKEGVYWNYLLFCHKVEQDAFKGGFVLSNLGYPKSGVLEGLSNNEYRANQKEQKVSNAYAVFCETDDMPEGHLNVVFPVSPQLKGACSLNNVLVNNTVAVADAVSATFEDGDVLSLKVTGYLAGKKTDEAEMKLAEFTTTKDSIVHNWTLLDLSKLGMVDSVRFAVIPPDGKSVPKAVCLDNLYANITITSE